MAGENTIREYLVGLGFKVDEKGLKNFVGNIENAGKAVAKLVTAVSGMSLAIAGSTMLFADHLEDLYFASVKAGSSATNLKALGQAAKNLGATAEESVDAVQALARFMRETPGAEGYLATLGVQARDAKGNIRDTTEVLMDLGQVLSKKQFFEAKQYGDLFGMSEDALRLIMRGDLANAFTHQQQKLKNSGFDQASKDAHRFMMQLRDLQTSLETFGIAVQKALMAHFHVSLKSIGRWLDTNGPRIGKQLGEILDKVLSLVDALAPAVVHVVDKLIELDRSTDGLSTKVLALTAAFVALGGPAVLSSLASVLGALTKVAVAAGGIAIEGAGTVAAGAGTAAVAGAGLVGGAGLAAVVAAVVPIALVAATAWLASKAAEAILPETNLPQGEKEWQQGEYLKASFHLSAGQFLQHLVDAATDKLAGVSNPAITSTPLLHPGIPGSTSNVVVNSTNHYHINGGDANAIAKKVDDTTSRQNQILTRNLATRAK